MKKILLRIPRMGSEMASGEFMEMPESRTAFAREIKLPERFHHPHIHWKHLLKPIGKEQNTIGNFTSHAWKFEQFRACLCHAHRPQRRQIHRSASQHLSGAQQVGGTETHL